MVRNYGWKRAEPSTAYKLYEAAPLTSLPKSVDLRSQMPPVYDQAQLGSCTANALAGCVEHLQEVTMPSRLFIYYNERKIDGDVNQDSGSTITTGISSLRQYGVCPETVWPYNPGVFTEAPPEIAYTDATKDIIGDAMNLHTLEDLKNCLASGFPFAFGFTVYNYFEGPEIAQSGVMRMPNPMSDTVIGGHAVVGVGYDDDKQAILVRNSWGPSWGDQGHFWMPYQFITNASLASDFWTIRSFKQ
jgi:C1A family cysteine protease